MANTVNFVNTDITQASIDGAYLIYRQGGVMVRKTLASISFRAVNTVRTPELDVLLAPLLSNGVVVQVTLDGVNEMLVTTVDQFQQARALVGSRTTQFIRSAAATATNITGATRSCCGGNKR